jgi:hypothetical protein
VERVRRQWLSLDDMGDVDVPVSRRPLSSSIVKLHQASHDTTKTGKFSQRNSFVAEIFYTPLDQNFRVIKFSQLQSEVS